MIHDIYQLLPKLIGDSNFVFIPNPGNAGDSLITLGAKHVFQSLNWNRYRVGGYGEVFDNEILVYSGGGNLVGLYDQCEIFLKNNAEKNKIIVLPHTIKDVDSLLDQSCVKNNVIFICRDNISYKYVKQFTEKVYLSHDLVFYIDKKFLLPYYDKVPTDDIAYCFRTDVEKFIKNNTLYNNDISRTLNQPNNTSDRNNEYSISQTFFEYLSQYNTIHTDRLHVAIAGSLLNKVVYLYPNSYYKNLEIFNLSIKNRFPKTIFLENFYENS